MPGTAPFARWSAPGPWLVRLILRWYPLGTGQRWCRLTVRRHSQRVPSGEAALASARRLLTTSHRTPVAGLAAVVEVRDRAGRLAWRGASEASLREAARLAAGWFGEPPTASGPIPPTSSRPPSGLTLAQRRVVAHPGGPAVVLAVAGAGKTTTMVARVRALVEAGVAPEHVLVTSFSRAAVADVRDKLGAVAPPDLSSVEVRTFHALAARLLREAVSSAGGAQMPGPPPEQVAGRLLDLVTEAWRREAHPLAPALDALDRDAFLTYRSRCLAQLALPDPDGRGLPAAARRHLRHPPRDPEAEVHAPLLAAHERLRRERGWRDYDDLVVDAWAALMSDAGLRQRTARRWTHRIVDEFQDVNPAQVALLEALLDDEREVMLIGDDDQSIYGFRGSDPRLLQAVGERLGARRYVLDHNFRGRPEPLAAAAALIERLPERLPKRLRAARDLGGTLTLDLVAGPQAEAACALARLRAAHADGFGWQRQALLLRGFAQASAIELALLCAGVPYQLIGAPDLLRQPICRAALAGLHLVAVPEAPRAVRAQAWRRWLLALGLPPARAIERAAALAASGDGGAAALACETGRTGLRTLRGHDAAVRDATERLAQAATEGVVAGLAAAGQALLPWPRRGRAATSLRAFGDAVLAGAFGPATLGVAPFLAQLPAERRRRATGERVCLTSAHRSKGLEWDVVVVPGQVLGVFPVRDDAEERRLAYVAWTRARERLHLIADANAPASPFLRDAELDSLVTLQRDLRWCRSGVGSTALATTWALQDARRRFGHEPTGTRDPRRTEQRGLGS